MANLSMLARALVLWAAIIPLAIGNGVFREKFLAPRLAATWAQAISGLMLGPMIFLVALLGIGWVPVSTAAGCWRTGALWLGCTVAFEFIFGHYVARKSWSVLRQAYSFKRGEFWPALLVIVLVSPYLAALARGLV